MTGVFGRGRAAAPGLYFPQYVPEPRAYETEKEEEGPEEKGEEEPKRKRAKMPAAGHNDHDDRQAKMVQWDRIVVLSGLRSAVGRQVKDTPEEERRATIENALADKATNTLARRASSIGLYVRWFEQNIGPEVEFPPAEGTVYAYVESLRHEQAPATRSGVH